MTPTKKRALLHYGGWEGHQPEAVADFAQRELLGEFEVTRSQDLDMFSTEILSQFDVLVPVWTFGQISCEQEQALIDAVAGGLGIVAWHGNASAFLQSRPHKFLLGGQFVCHPGGENVSYDVKFSGNDEIVSGLEDLTVCSEQYYLLIDPAVKVLATTVMRADTMPWVAGVTMPVAWKRDWGRGHVFYCALGHGVDLLRHPSLKTMLDRALNWAVRGTQASAQPVAKNVLSQEFSTFAPFGSAVPPCTTPVV